MQIYIKIICAKIFSIFFLLYTYFSGLMTRQTVSKNLLLFSLFFSTSAIFTREEFLIVSEETEKKRIEEAKIDFGDEEQNNTKINRHSEKSAFEQFLDAAQQNKNFGYVDVKTPYRSMQLISGQTEAGKTSDGYYYSASFRSLYPHRMEVPSAYSAELYKKLKDSDLLVAQAFIQMQEAERLNTIIPTKKHGFWRCYQGNCWKMDQKELLEAFSESLNPKSNSTNE